MAKSKGIAEGVVFDETHIPPEYEALGPIHSSNKRHHNALVKACESNKIRRIRLRRSAGDIYGHLYVHRQDAAEVIRESDERFAGRTSEPQTQTSTTVDNRFAAVAYPGTRISAGQIEAAITALCEINNGITLMQATLERLATAAESVATEPKEEAVGTWRDMNGECH